MALRPWLWSGSPLSVMCNNPSTIPQFRYLRNRNLTWSQLQDVDLILQQVAGWRKLETGKSEIVLKETGLSWLTLFAASGTLICCALPIVLVTLGLLMPSPTGGWK